MKCPKCKGNVPGRYRGQTCPSCGEPLPRGIHLLIEWGRRVASFTEDRGFIFWLLTFSGLLALVALFENLFGQSPPSYSGELPYKGQLTKLLDQHKFISVLMLIYSAAYMKVIRNLNSTVRPGYPGPYWTDRLIIKKFRQGTNVSLILGLITSFIVVGPLNVLELLPAYILIISLFPALFWSIESFRVDDKEFLDAKVQTYFYYLGIKKLRDWRKVGGAYMITVVVCSAIFYGLSHTHGLWWMIKQNPTLNEVIETVDGLFSWMPSIVQGKLPPPKP
jgi:hypothetical protein